MESSYHSKVERAFAEYLITIGYPKDSIIYEPAFLTKDGKRWRPDFLIIDPAKNERLAIIEIKSSITSNQESIRNQLRAYSKSIGNDKIPVFLITPAIDGSSQYPFDFYIFNNDGELAKSELSLFPTFAALSAEETAERKDDLRTKKTKTSENFKYVCWALSFLLLIIAIADLIGSRYDMIIINTERMAILGACVALIIIPFAQKFKGLGIEFEKATQSDQGG
jgi:hypothetical protein